MWECLWDLLPITLAQKVEFSTCELTSQADSGMIYGQMYVFNSEKWPEKNHIPELQSIPICYGFWQHTLYNYKQVDKPPCKTSGKQNVIYFLVKY